MTLREREQLFADAKTIVEMFSMYPPYGRVLAAVHADDTYGLMLAVAQALDDERCQNTPVIRERLQSWQVRAEQYIATQKQLAARKAEAA